MLCVKNQSLFIKTAVGFISVVGYTPDIFTGLINGYFLDKYNEVIGHQIVFGIMAGFAVIGCIASYYLYKNTITRKVISN